MDDRIIYFDIAAIAILLILLFSIFFRRMNKGRVNLIFILLLIIIVLNTLCDLGSAAHLHFIEDSAFRTELKKIFSTCYFMFRISAGPLYFIFIAMLTGSWNRFQKHRAQVVIFLAPFVACLIMLIVNFFSGFIFYYDNQGTYHRGNLIILFYAAGAFYLLCSMVLLFMTRTLLDREKFYALLSMFPLQVLAILIQFIWSDLLLEMFSLAMMGMLVTNTVLRAEENVDYNTGARSYKAFSTDISRCLHAEIPLNIIFVRLKNNSALLSILGNEPHRELLQSISRILIVPKNPCPHGLSRDLFYLYDGLYAINIDGNERDAYTELEAASVLNELQNSFHTHHLDLDLDVSVGTVRVPEDISNWNDLLSYANSFDRSAPDTEVAVFEKHAPDKQFRISTDIDSIIGRALQNNSFVLYYQPIYSVREKRFITAEALIRLIDEKDGIISPGIFIPAAEKNGTIHRIGDFVIQDVCRFIEEHNLSDLGLRFIEVNLSTVQCMRNNVVERIDQTLKEHHVSSRFISLEITETASNFVYDTVKANILSLHDMGLEFALDDYGSGYSNIQRMVDMPFKVIKLDKQFVDEWEHPRMRSVIQNTIRLIKDLGDEIVVEGVETKEAAEWFAEQGCDYIQGFYYARPMPENEFLLFLKNQEQ